MRQTMGSTNKTSPSDQKDCPSTMDSTDVNQLTPVMQMFHNRSVFITGASGFIGRVLLEKLLRSYQGIRRVYILMRPKRNQHPYDRLHKQLLKVPIFDRIRAMKNGDELLDKIVIVAGDIAEPRLGISDGDMARMESDETLSIVFHSAATIKFDEPIKQSVQLNLIATREIINLCKRLPNLIGLCHVSTAYVNSDILDNSDIEEKLYPIKYRPQDLIKMSELMDEDLMQTLKVQLVGQRPNTYTFTKAMAEHLIATEAADLPVTIVRPSIVTAAWKEPMPGWVDNLNGPTGLILAFAKGIMRTLHLIRSKIADIIPVDVVVNTMIASTFYTAKLHNKLEIANVGQPTSINAQPDPKGMTSGDVESSVGEDDSTSPHIVHCTSGDLNPFRWGRLEEMYPIVSKYPPSQVIRYPGCYFASNCYVDLIIRIFAHYIPALIIDMICGLLGKKRQSLFIYGKLHGALTVYAHFRKQNYNFKARSFRRLEVSLSEADKKDLFMDITSLDWRNYFDSYFLGIRRYILKEPDDNLPEAKRSFKR